MHGLLNNNKPNPEGWHVYRNIIVLQTYDPGRGRMLRCVMVFYKHPTALPSFSFLSINIYSIIISIFNPYQKTLQRQ